MIGLHTHTFFSDGELLPSELVYRAKCRGYTAICLCDHVDFSNIDFVIPRIVKASKLLTEYYKITAVPGAEITYVPPKLITKTVGMARKLGAKIVVIHGETTAEEVPSGTNRAGILSGADILAHPGKISVEEARLAGKKNVLLEITSRKGHRNTNKHVAILAKRHNVKMVFNNDAHSLNDLIDERGVRKTLKLAGLTWNDYLTMQSNARRLIESKVKTP